MRVVGGRETEGKAVRGNTVSDKSVAGSSTAAQSTNQGKRGGVPDDSHDAPARGTNDGHQCVLHRGDDGG